MPRTATIASSSSRQGTSAVDSTSSGLHTISSPSDISTPYTQENVVPPSSTHSVSATEHCFLVGADASALPFYSSPRVVIANGPAPEEGELSWHDEESYQDLLNKTTVRCVNILGKTALRPDIQQGKPILHLRLLEMHDERVPESARADRGMGFYCCLFDEQKSNPVAILAVYHVNPFYSTDLLCRVKAKSHKDKRPLVAERPEDIILALIGRQMAAADCSIGIITNGHLLIVCEAGSANSHQVSAVRTHTQGYIDCSAAMVASPDVSLRDASSVKLHGHPDPEQNGFVRADMMFIWLALAVHAYQKHVEQVSHHRRIEVAAEARQVDAYENFAKVGGGSRSDSFFEDPSSLEVVGCTKDFKNDEEFEISSAGTSATNAGPRQQSVPGTQGSCTSTKVSGTAPGWLKHFSSRKNWISKDREDELTSVHGVVYDKVSHISHVDGTLTSTNKTSACNKKPSISADLLATRGLKTEALDSNVDQRGGDSRQCGHSLLASREQAISRSSSFQSRCDFKPPDGSRLPTVGEGTGSKRHPDQENLCKRDTYLARERHPLGNHHRSNEPQVGSDRATRENCVVSQPPPDNPRRLDDSWI